MPLKSYVLVMKRVLGNLTPVEGIGNVPITVQLKDGKMAEMVLCKERKSQLMKARFQICKSRITMTRVQRTFYKSFPQIKASKPVKFSSEMKFRHLFILSKGEF
jgi:hypothetical protein